MFAKAFHGGPFVEVLTQTGKNPALQWKLQPRNQVKREFDKSVRGYIFRLEGGPNTIIQLPKDERRETLGLFQRYLVVQLYLEAGKSFGIDIGITDTNKQRRRIILSTSTSETTVNPLHARVAIGNLIERNVWTNFCVDIAELARTLFRATFKSADILVIHAACRIRRIFTMRSPPAFVDYGSGLGSALDPNEIVEELPRSTLFPADVPWKVQLLRTGIVEAAASLQREKKHQQREMISREEQEEKERMRVYSSTDPKDAAPMTIAFGSRLRVADVPKPYVGKRSYGKLPSHSGSQSSLQRRSNPVSPEYQGHIEPPAPPHKYSPGVYPSPQNEQPAPGQHYAPGTYNPPTGGGFQYRQPGIGGGANVQYAIQQQQQQQQASSPPPAQPRGPMEYGSPQHQRQQQLLQEQQEQEAKQQEQKYEDEEDEYMPQGMPPKHPHSRSHVMLPSPKDAEQEQPEELAGSHIPRLLALSPVRVKEPRRISRKPPVPVQEPRPKPKMEPQPREEPENPLLDSQSHLRQEPSDDDDAFGGVSGWGGNIGGRASISDSLTEGQFHRNTQEQEDLEEGDVSDGEHEEEEDEEGDNEGEASAHMGAASASRAKDDYADGYGYDDAEDVDLRPSSADGEINDGAYDGNSNTSLRSYEQRETENWQQPAIEDQDDVLSGEPADGEVPPPAVDEATRDAEEREEDSAAEDLDATPQLANNTGGFDSDGSVDGSNASFIVHSAQEMVRVPEEEKGAEEPAEPEGGADAAAAEVPALPLPDEAEDEDEGAGGGALLSERLAADLEQDDDVMLGDDDDSAEVELPVGAGPVVADNDGPLSLMRTNDGRSLVEVSCDGVDLKRASFQKGETEMVTENDDVDLMYDPVLDIYFDPVSNKYFKAKDVES